MVLPSGKTMVLGVAPKRLENQEENRFSKNRSEGGQPVDFRCSRPPPPACCGCGCLPLEGSAKTSDLALLQILSRAVKKALKKSRRWARDIEEKLQRSLYVGAEEVHNSTIFFCPLHSTRHIQYYVSYSRPDLVTFHSSCT